MRYILTFVFMIFSMALSSQSREIDSVRILLKQKNIQDTLKASYINELSWQFLDYSVDSSEKYVAQAIGLSQHINYTEGIVVGKNTQGIIYRMRNEPDKAIQLYKDIIPIRIAQNRKDRLTGVYANLGTVYYEMDDPAMALSYYTKAYDNARNYKQTENEIAVLNNLGATYKSAGLYDLALETFRKALQLNKILKNDIQEGQLYLNLATVYNQRGAYQQGFEYDQHAYRIFKRTDNLRQLSIVVYNLTISARQTKHMKAAEAYIREMESIAAQLDEQEYYSSLHHTKSNYFLTLHHYQEALDEINRALSYADTTQGVYAYSIMLLVKSDCYKGMGQYKSAMLYADRGISLLKDMSDATALSKAYMSKSNIYRGMHDYQNALSYYEKANDLKDSVITDDFDTKVATLNSFNQLDRKERELELSNKEKEKVSAENKRQYTLLIGSVIVVFLIIVLLVLSWRAYKRKQKDNTLLHHQKQEIETKNKTLEEQKAVITHQKDIVEEKQKEILDSILYAEQIQRTLLANHSLVNEIIPDSFVYFQPKDIVSGDFYWATKKENRFYLAVCDSTGHGVPGAFMSLLNMTYLNEAINEKNMKEPNEVFDHVRRRLIENIAQYGRQDGMDAILLCFEDKSDTVYYAAANNAPVLISGGVLTELPADKMPIGKGEKQDAFTAYRFDIKKNDVIYLYTDGFADQFGGPKGKKFKYKQLEDLLLSIHAKPVKEQELTLEKSFLDWRGSLEQIDDVCIIGIRV